MINVISTFYISNYSSQLDNLRTKELEDALIKNIESHHIEKIHLFVDNIESFKRLKIISKNSDKINVIDIGKQPLVSDFFKFILDNLPNKICMIINSDIYLETCDEKILQLLNHNKFAYALTRHEWDMSTPLIDIFGGSHDCYIFNSTNIDKSIINEHTMLKQNNYGIESHIIKSLLDLGIQILNPCNQIKIVHLHKSELRKYSGSCWIGLHECGNYEEFYNSPWCIKPTYIILN
jgi:hypothetical protein